jgi:hypothetical protein
MHIASAHTMDGSSISRVRRSARSRETVMSTEPLGNLNLKGFPLLPQTYERAMKGLDGGNLVGINSPERTASSSPGSIRSKRISVRGSIWLDLYTSMMPPLIEFACSLHATK